MVIVSPLRIELFPLQMALLWLINGGDPNYLKQVLGWSSKYSPRKLRSWKPMSWRWLVQMMFLFQTWWFFRFQNTPSLLGPCFGVIKLDPKMSARQFGRDLRATVHCWSWLVSYIYIIMTPEMWLIGEEQISYISFCNLIVLGILFVCLFGLWFWHSRCGLKFMFQA